MNTVVSATLPAAVLPRMRRGAAPPWYYRASGKGEPIVLLHGLGMSHAVWDAVTPRLSATHRVIAFDIAGFGCTPPLSAGTCPTVQHLTDGLCDSLRDLGINDPVHLVGNSLGGTIALEAARRGRARTVVAISPACLWNATPPVHVRYLFAAMHGFARHYPALARSAMTVRWLRELALAVPLSPGSGCMTVADARRTLEALAGSTRFRETFEATRAPFVGGRSITVPVTIVFGNRDLILNRRSRVRDQVPSHTRWIEQKGWGHVPMWVDPIGVARLILSATTVQEDILAVGT